MPAAAARRVLLWKAKGAWYWKAQGMNWRTLETGSKTREASARKEIAAKYPGVEVVAR